MPIVLASLLSALTQLTPAQPPAEPNPPLRLAQHDPADDDAPPRSDAGATTPGLDHQPPWEPPLSLRPDPPAVSLSRAPAEVSGLSRPLVAGAQMGTNVVCAAGAGVAVFGVFICAEPLFFTPQFCLGAALVPFVFPGAVAVLDVVLGNRVGKQDGALLWPLLASYGASVAAFTTWAAFSFFLFSVADSGNNAFIRDFGPFIALGGGGLALLTSLAAAPAAYWFTSPLREEGVEPSLAPRMFRRRAQPARPAPGMRY